MIKSLNSILFVININLIYFILIKMSGVPHAMRKSQEQNLEQAENQEQLNEEEMKNQELEDDEDIRELKEKLKRMSEQKPPENKDDLI